ncbi:MAG: hypothetical protein S4CHLAM7_10660 [Chlamydiae bacterium]|nr:hypothetical protein [Chlamydiota bacterium]
MATVTILGSPFALKNTINPDHDTIVDIQGVPEGASKFESKFTALIAEKPYKEPFLVFCVNFSKLPSLPFRSSFDSNKALRDFSTEYLSERQEKDNEPSRLAQSILDKTPGLTQKESHFLTLASAVLTHRNKPPPITCIQKRCHLFYHDKNPVEFAPSSMLLTSYNPLSTREGIKHFCFFIDSKILTRQRASHAMFHRIDAPPPPPIASDLHYKVSVMNPLSKNEGTVTLKVFPDSIENHPCSTATLSIRTKGSIENTLKTAAKVLHFSLSFSKKPTESYSRELNLFDFPPNNSIEIEVSSIKNLNSKTNVKIDYYSCPPPQPDRRLLKLSRSNLETSTNSSVSEISVNLRESEFTLESDFLFKD